MTRPCSAHHSGAVLAALAKLSPGRLRIAAFRSRLSALQAMHRPHNAAGRGHLRMVVPGWAPWRKVAHKRALRRLFGAVS